MDSPFRQICVGGENRPKTNFSSFTNWSFSLTLSYIAHLKSHPRTRFFFGRRSSSRKIFGIFYIGNRISNFRRFSRIFMIFVQKKFKFKKAIEFSLYCPYFFTPRKFLWSTIEAPVVSFFVTSRQRPRRPSTLTATCTKLF